jgi:hypothetical protein
MPDMEIPVRIGADVVGVAVSSDANHLLFYSPKAFPPGQPLELTLWPDTPEAFNVEARSLGSKLRDDRRFEVRSKVINLSRERREKLLRAFSAA